jgi:hypothetical protein
MMRHTAAMALAAVLVMGSFSAVEAAPVQRPTLLTRMLNRVSAWNQNRIQVKAAKQEFADLVNDPTVKSLYKAAKSEQGTGWMQVFRVTHYANVGVQSLLLHTPAAFWAGAALMFSLQQSWGLTKNLEEGYRAARSKTVALAMHAGHQVGQAKLKRLHKAKVIDMEQVAKAAPKAKAKKTAEARRARG